ncbi:hypothetical protein ACIP5Y_19985 [Nocardia sp. NPDC088792]|uniref:phthiocerol/phthiodiolone dimycocerosyl transferase family protein n=1 Tax=Nocardia sp. NPDC088792 TaxID=3364332 RepID=UPI003818FC4E
MTERRPLSPFEIGYFGHDTRLGSVPIGGMPLFIGSTVRGRIDPELLRRVLGELAAGHVLLRSRVIENADGTKVFETDDTYVPALEVRAGGGDEYRELVNTRQDWGAGLFRAVLLHGADCTRIVLILHHGISDGRSAFALLDEMWRRYTAQLAGSPLPVGDSDRELVPGVDIQLAQVITEDEIDGFLGQVLRLAASLGPEAAPRTLPLDGVEDPDGRLALRRISLDAAQTTALVDIAREQGVSVNSLLGGAALAAVRAELDANPGALPMICGHAADLRGVLAPPLPDATILNCASGAGTPALVDRDADPLELAHAVEAGMRQVLDTRFPALFMRASHRPLDPATTAILTGGPSIALSNIGRLPAHSIPAGVEWVRDDVFAMAASMPPKMTIFTVGDRMTIQVEYDTAEHSHAQLDRVGAAMRAQLDRVSAAALRG